MSPLKYWREIKNSKRLYRNKKYTAARMASRILITAIVTGQLDTMELSCSAYSRFQGRLRALRAF
jgi:hypothetical protein